MYVLLRIMISTFLKTANERDQKIIKHLSRTWQKRIYLKSVTWEKRIYLKHVMWKNIFVKPVTLQKQFIESLSREKIQIYLKHVTW